MCVCVAAILNYFGFGQNTWKRKKQNKKSPRWQWMCQTAPHPQTTKLYTHTPSLSREQEATHSQNNPSPMLLSSMGTAPLPLLMPLVSMFVWPTRSSGWTQTVCHQRQHQLQRRSRGRAGLRPCVVFLLVGAGLNKRTTGWHKHSWAAHSTVSCCHFGRLKTLKHVPNPEVIHLRGLFRQKMWTIMLVCSGF